MCTPCHIFIEGLICLVFLTSNGNLFISNQIWIFPKSLLMVGNWALLKSFSRLTLKEHNVLVKSSANNMMNKRGPKIEPTLWYTCSHRHHWWMGFFETDKLNPTSEILLKPCLFNPIYAIVFKSFWKKGIWPKLSNAFEWYKNTPKGNFAEFISFVMIFIISRDASFVESKLRKRYWLLCIK